MRLQLKIMLICSIISIVPMVFFWENRYMFFFLMTLFIPLITIIASLIVFFEKRIEEEEKKDIIEEILELNPSIIREELEKESYYFLMAVKEKLERKQEKEKINYFIKD